MTELELMRKDDVKVNVVVIVVVVILVVVFICFTIATFISSSRLFRDVIFDKIVLYVKQ